MKSTLVVAMLLCGHAMATCPAGYACAGTMAFKWHEASKNWADAQAVCESEGSWLATPVNAAEKDATVAARAVASGTSQTAWLGGSDEAVYDTWRWVVGPLGLEDGGQGRKFFQGHQIYPATTITGTGCEPGAYCHFSNYEPNGISSENHLLMYADGFWNDGQGPHPLPAFVCQKNIAATPEPPAPPACPAGYACAGTMAFKWNQETKNWADAQALCAADGSWLATPVNAAEKDATMAARTAASGTAYTAWLGGSDEAVYDTWRWVVGPLGLEDGGQGRKFFQGHQIHPATTITGTGCEPGAYCNFANYEPNGISTENHLLMYADGFWNDGQGSSTMPAYVCQKDLTVVPPLPIEPQILCVGGCMWGRCANGFFRSDVGDYVELRLEGTTVGDIWGSGQYSSDSVVAAAAVHAGVLAVGESKNVRLRCVGEIPSFTGSTEFQVTSQSFPSPYHAFEFVESNLTPSPVPVCYHWWCGTKCFTAGQQFEMVVTGQVSGEPIWGGSIYTSDSDMRVAAVHAGVLTPGQTATLRVMCYGPQTSFASSTHHGITSQSYGPWQNTWALQLAE